MPPGLERMESERKRHGEVCRHYQHVHSGVTVLLMIQSNRHPGVSSAQHDDRCCSRTPPDPKFWHVASFHLLLLAATWSTSHWHMSTLNWSHLMLIVIIFLSIVKASHLAHSLSLIQRRVWNIFLTLPCVTSNWTFQELIWYDFKLCTSRLFFSTITNVVRSHFLLTKKEK